MRDNAHCGPILVTDDDDLLRTYVIDLLEQAGYAASGAASGQQALELARRERPSLVVLDVLMPDLSGYEPVLDYGTGPFPSDGLPVDLRPLPR